MHGYSTEIGIIGVVLVLLCYFLLQFEKLQSKGFTYSFLNLLGALGVLYSLFFEWNLSAFIIELAWVLISIYGLVRFFMKKKADGK